MSTMSTMDFFSAMRSWGPGVQADAAALRKEATNPSETDPVRRDMDASAALAKLDSRVAAVEVMAESVEAATADHPNTIQQLAKVAKMLQERNESARVALEEQLMRYGYDTSTTPFVNTLNDHIEGENRMPSNAAAMKSSLKAGKGGKAGPADEIEEVDENDSGLINGVLRDAIMDTPGRGENDFMNLLASPEPPLTTRNAVPTPTKPLTPKLGSQASSKHQHKRTAASTSGGGTGAASSTSSSRGGRNKTTSPGAAYAKAALAAAEMVLSSPPGGETAPRAPFSTSSSSRRVATTTTPKAAATNKMKTPGRQVTSRSSHKHHHNNGDEEENGGGYESNGSDDSNPLTPNLEPLRLAAASSTSSSTSTSDHNYNPTTTAKRGFLASANSTPNTAAFTPGVHGGNGDAGESSTGSSIGWRRSPPKTPLLPAAPPTHSRAALSAAKYAAASSLSSRKVTDAGAVDESDDFDCWADEDENHSGINKGEGGDNSSGATPSGNVGDCAQGEGAAVFSPIPNLASRAYGNLLSTPETPGEPEDMTIDLAIRLTASALKDGDPNVMDQELDDEVKNCEMDDEEEEKVGANNGENNMGGVEVNENRMEDEDTHNFVSSKAQLSRARRSRDGGHTELLKQPLQVAMNAAADDDMDEEEDGVEKESEGMKGSATASIAAAAATAVSATASTTTLSPVVAALQLSLGSPDAASPPPPPLAGEKLVTQGFTSTPSAASTGAAASTTPASGVQPPLPPGVFESDIEGAAATEAAAAAPNEVVVASTPAGAKHEGNQGHMGAVDVSTPELPLSPSATTARAAAAATPQASALLAFEATARTTTTTPAAEAGEGQGQQQRGGPHSARRRSSFTALASPMVSVPPGRVAAASAANAMTSSSSSPMVASPLSPPLTTAAPVAAAASTSSARTPRSTRKAATPRFSRSSAITASSDCTTGASSSTTPSSSSGGAVSGKKTRRGSSASAKKKVNSAAATSSPLPSDATGAASPVTPQMAELTVNVPLASKATPPTAATTVSTATPRRKSTAAAAAAADARTPTTRSSARKAATPRFNTTTSAAATAAAASSANLVPFSLEAVSVPTEANTPKTPTSKTPMAGAASTNRPLTRSAAKAKLLPPGTPAAAAAAALSQGLPRVAAVTTDEFDAAPQYLKYQCSLNMLNGALQLVNQAYGLDAATTAAASGSTSGMLEFTVSEESLLATIQQAAAKATGGAKTVVLGLSKLKRLRMDRAHSAVHLAMRLPNI